MSEHFVLRHNSKRFALTFEWSRNRDFDFQRGNGKKPKARRNICNCYLREAYTGRVYTGTAVLHPKEEDSYDYIVSRNLAMKRAIKAYVFETALMNTRPILPGEIFWGIDAGYMFDFARKMDSDFRFQLLEQDNPTEYKRVVDFLSEQKKKTEEAKAAHEKRLKYERRVARRKAQMHIADETLGLKNS